MTITGYRIDTGDDCIAIKGERVNGAVAGTCQNITITGYTISEWARAEYRQRNEGVCNVQISNCIFTTNGIRIKSEFGLSRLVQNVSCRNTSTSKI